MTPMPGLFAHTVTWAWPTFLVLRRAATTASSSIGGWKLLGRGWQGVPVVERPSDPCDHACLAYSSLPAAGTAAARRLGGQRSSPPGCWSGVGIHCTFQEMCLPRWSSGMGLPGGCQVS